MNRLELFIVYKSLAKFKMFMLRHIMMLITLFVDYSALMKTLQEQMCIASCSEALLSQNNATEIHVF